MLVDLTPNQAEIDRRVAIAVEHNFEYEPQHLDKWKQGIGIYQNNTPFNFTTEEFNEELDGWDMNEGFDWSKDNFEEDFIHQYGVADTIEQIKEFYKKQVDDPLKKYVITLTPVCQDKSNKGKGGGWRWHKWGKYIGDLNPECEYLDDEDFGEDFEYVICFHLYEVK